MAAEAPGAPVALVSGATGPLGRVVARSFAEGGYRVALGGTDAERLRSLATDLGLPDGRWVPAVGDLREAAGAVAAVAAAIDAFGRVDVLLHLVGGWAGGTAIVDLDPGDVRDMLDQHLWTTLNVIRAAVPGMLERGFGRVLAVSTPFARDPRPNGAAYAVAKAAEEALVRTLAREVGDRGVTANLVIVRKIDAEHARRTTPTAANAAWTTPEEVAAALRFLAAPDAAAVNGARLELDGRA